MRLQFRSAILIAAIALSACGGAPADLSNPTVVATAFLAAIEAKNPQALLPITSGENRTGVEEAIQQGPGSTAYKRIFDEEIIKQLRAARGEFDGPRYRDGLACFRITAKDEDGEIKILKLKKFGATWVIDDVDDVVPEEFEKLPKTPS